MNITVTVNGQTYAHDVEPRLLLVHYLRDVLGRLPTHPVERLEELLPHRWAALRGKASA